MKLCIQTMNLRGDQIQLTPKLTNRGVDCWSKLINSLTKLSVTMGVNSKLGIRHGSH